MDKREKQLEASRKWKARNKEKLKEYSKLYREANSEKIKALKKQWNAENATHIKEYNEKWTLDNEKYYQDKHLKYTYGISLDDYEVMRQQQQNKCACCGKHEKETPRQRLFVDHCHKTGKIRALLCQHCNTALGMVNDDPDILISLISYLKEHQ